MHPAILITIVVLCFILILAGIILTVASLPGVWLIFIAYLITAILSGFESISILGLIAIFVIALLSTFIDNLVLLASAKKTGASKWGVLGALLGALIGMVIGGPVGLIVGPFVGVLLFEIVLNKSELLPAIKSGSGTVLAFFASIVLKTGVNVLLLALWILIVLNYLK